MRQSNPETVVAAAFQIAICWQCSSLIVSEIYR